MYSTPMRHIFPSTKVPRLCTGRAIYAIPPAHSGIGELDHAVLCLGRDRWFWRGQMLDSGKG
jgi:hypothetical protein